MRIAPGTPCKLLLLAVACASPQAFAAEGFRGAFVSSDDGARIHYLQGGTPGRQPAVVFIPGWTWTSEVWIEQTGDGVRVWSDDSNAEGVFTIEASWETFEKAVAVLRAEMEEFSRSLEAWAASVGPQNADAFVKKVRQSLAIPAPGT